MSADLSRWTPQPRAAGVTYISAEAKVALDLSESRVSQMHSSIVARLKDQLGRRRPEFD